MFSSREPGQSLIGVPTYAIAYKIEKHLNYSYVGHNKTPMSDQRVQIWTIYAYCIFAALSPLLFFVFARSNGISNGWSFFISCFIAFGTLNWRYSSSLYRQPLIVAYLLLCYLLAIKKANNIKSLFLGLIMGSAIFTDVTSLSWILVIFVFLLYKLFLKDINWTKLIITFLGLIMWVIFLLLYHYLIFGEITITAHKYEGNPAFSWQKSNIGTFTTPLWPSMWINMFSNAPIPVGTFSSEFWNDDQKEHQRVCSMRVFTNTKEYSFKHLY